MWTESFFSIEARPAAAWKGYIIGGLLWYEFMALFLPPLPCGVQSMSKKEAMEKEKEEAATAYPPQIVVVM